MLHKALFFKYEVPGQRPCVFRSLGFHGHAALGCVLEVISGPASEQYLQMSKVGQNSGRCQQPTPLRCVFGHEVKQLEHFHGLAVELLIPALKPPPFGPDAVSGLGLGLVYKVVAERDLLPFCFQERSH